MTARAVSADNTPYVALTHAVAISGDAATVRHQARFVKGATSLNLPAYAPARPSRIGADQP